MALTKVQGEGITALNIDSKGQVGLTGSTTAFDTTGAVNGLQLYYESDSGISTIGPYSNGGNTSLSLHTNSGGGASAEAMNITSSGEITKPLQPCFSVTKSATQSNIATSTNVDVTFDTEYFDVGSNFASNVFTAPVTGKYQLNATLRVDALDSAADYYFLYIKTSNNTYAVIYDPDFGQDAVYWTFLNSVLADMDANDTAEIEIYQEGGTQQTDIVHTISWCQFNGVLVC